MDKNKCIDEFKKCRHFDADLGEPVLARYDLTSGTTVQWCARCGAFKYGPEKWQRPYLLKEIAG